MGVELLAAWEPNPASAFHASLATPLTQRSKGHGVISDYSPAAGQVLNALVKSTSALSNRSAAENTVKTLETMMLGHHLPLLSPSQTSTAVCSRHSSIAKRGGESATDAGCNATPSVDHETNISHTPKPDFLDESCTHSSEFMTAYGDSDDDNQPLATILPGFRRNRPLSDQPAAIQLRLCRQQHGSNRASCRPATWHHDPLRTQMIWGEDSDPAFTLLDPRRANRFHSCEAIDDAPPRYDDAVSTSVPSTSPAYIPHLPTQDGSAQPFGRPAMGAIGSHSKPPASTARGLLPTTHSSTVVNEHLPRSSGAPVHDNRPMFQRSTSSLHSGAGNLPPYQCTIQKEGKLLVKVEFDDYNKRPKHRLWQ
ncbi:hypothetical protein H4R35_006194 [Dimargaris xerosporica]|nr:hypothetical protein H4R35_006194 [Dimargaris xerosporica]